MTGAKEKKIALCSRRECITGQNTLNRGSEVRPSFNLKLKASFEGREGRTERVRAAKGREFQICAAEKQGGTTTTLTSFVEGGD